MGIEWAASADKHGIDRDDALHAITNAYYTEHEFDEPRVPGRAKPTLFIGPPRTLGAPLLEVMIDLSPPREMVVFHVMEARQKHLDRMHDDWPEHRPRDSETPAPSLPDRAPRPSATNQKQVNPMTDETPDYDALADWAEHEMALPADSTTALRGGDAAAAGRALLDRAGIGGRPKLDPTDEPGSESPKRQVRLPKTLSQQVDRIAAQQGRKPAAVMRDAIAAYAQNHTDRPTG